MPEPAVITIGIFDGVHVGHRRILTRGRAAADALGVPLTAMTFDPHPLAVLRPGTQPPRLMSLPARMDALRRAGADHVVTLKPTPQLLSLEPAAFLDTLAAEHRPRAVVEGANFRFGKGRRGEVSLLRAAGKRLGFETIVVDPVTVEFNDRLTPVVSSSLIRWLVGRGRVAEAARCMGQPYTLTAAVIRGEKRGQAIGVPTANLDLDAVEAQLIPADGVYAGRVELPDGTDRPAALSVGIKPTFDQTRLAVEAHLLDFDADLYGQTISVRFHRWIRDQYRFPGSKAIKEQLQRDVSLTRQWHMMGLLNDTAAAAGSCQNNEPRIHTDKHGC